MTSLQALLNPPQYRRDGKIWTFPIATIKGEWYTPDTQIREHAPRKRPQFLESGDLWDTLEIPNDIHSAEVDVQHFQVDAIDRKKEEASNSCGTGVFKTRVSEGKRLQPRQGHCEVCNIAVVQLEGTLVPPPFAAGLYIQRDQVVNI